jgi:hypothetical protein
MKSPWQRSLFDPGDGSTETPFELSGEPLSLPPAVVVEANGLAKVDTVARPTREQWVACEQVGDCEWVSFLRKHGRVPLLSDAKKPWDYAGWLMYYRILLEEHPEIPKRWDYWYRTMAAGHLLDEPIPKIRFTGGDPGSRSEGYKLIDAWVHLVDRYGGGWSSPMTVLLDWLLWGFGFHVDKPSLSAELNEQLYRAVDLGPLLLRPHDYLGAWISEQKGKWNPHAFYPTPYTVVELMVQINFAGLAPKEARSLTVNDCCMGSGRMLLHSSNWSLRLSGMDIDGQVLRAAKVNGALYAPWLVRPFPEEFFENESPVHNQE